MRASRGFTVSEANHSYSEKHIDIDAARKEAVHLYIETSKHLLIDVGIY